MHEAVFFVAVTWMTVLLVATVILVARGHGTLSRLLALDTVALILVALFILYAEANRRATYLDAALALAVVSFVATLAAARHETEGGPFG